MVSAWVPCGHKVKSEESLSPQVSPSDPIGGYKNGLGAVERMWLQYFNKFN